MKIQVLVIVYIIGGGLSEDLLLCVFVEIPC